MCPGGENCAHGEACERKRLEETLKTSPFGQVLRQACELENMIDLKITITPADLTVEEVRALRILKHERQRYLEKQNGKLPSAN